MLSYYKKSNSKKEKDVFMCMMTNILDEARFFSKYKQSILKIMGQIYGVVINNNLLEGQARDVAFKIIIEHLKNPDEPKLVEFGMTAVDIFKAKLAEWPQKASMLF